MGQSLGQNVDTLMAVHDHDGHLTEMVILYLDEYYRNTPDLPRYRRAAPRPFVFLEQLEYPDIPHN
jgi:hypothetical protein